MAAPPTSLAPRFREQLERLGGREDTEDPEPALEGALERAVGAARAAWPSIEIDTDRFLLYVAERAPREVPPSVAVADLHVADLYLACACAAGDSNAVAVFERTYFADVDAAVARMKRVLADDVKQAARVKLFMPDGSAPPRIVDYAGRGTIRAWFRVVVVRLGVSMQRAVRREVQLDEEGLANVPAEAAADPELSHLRTLYSARFEEAFREAIASLGTPDRAVLRYHYVDRLTIDEIGAIYRIHRVTAARRITRARDLLVAETRRLLAAQLSARESEVNSILRLLPSQLAITLGKYLPRTSIDTHTAHSPKARIEEK